MPIDAIKQLHLGLLSSHATPIYLQCAHAASLSLPHSLQLPPSYSHQLIDCVLSHSDRLLFSAIAQTPISNIAHLIRHLVLHPPSKPHILIFTRAERLIVPPFSNTIVPLLFRLPALCALPALKLLFVSRIPFPPFRAACAIARQPLVIFLPPPSEPQLVQLLSSSFAPTALPNLPHALHANARAYFPDYINAVVTILYPTTSNQSEIRRVALNLYPEYLLRMAAGTPAPASFNHVSHKLKAVLNNLYVHHIVPTHEQVRKEVARRAPQHPNNLPDALGFTATVLLVAAFLAAHNPPQHDVRYFTTVNTKRPKAAKKTTAKRSKPPVANSRPFYLERLIAIFAAVHPTKHDVPDLSDHAGCISTTALIHVSTLQTLRYISAEHSPDMLSEPKYRCNIGKDQAIMLGKMVRIDLHQYLHAT